MSLTFIDFFAGIGGFRRGLELAGHKCLGFCEYEKFAVMSYTMMHLVTQEQREQLMTMPLKQRQKEILKEEYRNGEWYANDIRTVRAADIPRADVWTAGFPCQDISVAGNQLGFKGKRSSLYFAVTGLVRDLEEEDRPEYLIFENVKNFLSVNTGYDFLKAQIELDEIGYDAEWDVLNSKNFGVPQNRERVFIAGHRRKRSTGKIFPTAKADGIHNKSGADKKETDEVTCCLMAGGNDKWQESYVKQIGNCMPTKTRENPNQGRIYDPNGISPCLSKAEGGGRQPMIPISMTRKSCKEIEIANTLCTGTPDKKKGNYSPVTGVAIPVLTPDRMKKQQNGRRFKENGEPMFTLTSQDKHGVAIIDTQGRKNKKPNPSDTCPTLRAEAHGNLPCIVQEPKGDNEEGLHESAPTMPKDSPEHNNMIASGIYTGCSEGFQRPPMQNLSRTLKANKHDAGVFDGMRIRKLTPRECFRLQGWTDEYFDLAAEINSDNQLYKQAGNGVTVTVIQAIAEKMN